MYWYINGMARRMLSRTFALTPSYRSNITNSLCGSMPRRIVMVTSMPAAVPNTGQTTWSRNWFPSIMSIYGSNCEEMIDPSFCIIIDLSYLRRQPSLMSNTVLGDWNVTLLTNDKLSSENGLDVIHGDVVHRRWLRFMLCMVFPLDNMVLWITPGCDAIKSNFVPLCLTHLFGSC